MIRKLLTSAAATALVAGAANALTLENGHADAADEPLPLAAQLDFAGGAVGGDVFIGLAPDNNSFPAGDLVVSVSISGGELSGAIGTDGIVSLSGGTLPASPSTTSLGASTSTGGAKGDTEVVLLVSNLNNCNLENADAALDANCFLKLPIVLTGGDLSVSVGVETDDNNPVNGTSAASPATIQITQTEDAFDVEITPDADSPVADVNAATGPFTATTGDVDLGTVEVNENVVEIGGNMRTVNVDLLGTDVAAGDYDEVEITVTGNFDAFEDGNTPAGDLLINGAGFDTVDSATDTAVEDDLAFATSGLIAIDPDGVTAIPASTYSVSAVVTPDANSDLDATQTTSGSLASIVRNGTTIVFPWTQSATQGAASGTISVFRLGNLDMASSGAVFAEVKNSSEAGFTSMGIVELATGIDGGGEFVINSSTLESELGNWGRGDVEFTVEADDATLTGRQFVVRGDVIQQVSGGNIDQDLN